MPYDRPTLQTLIDRTRNDLIARLAEDDVLRRADAEIYARVIAAASHSINGFIEYVAKQIIIDTADVDFWSAGARSGAFCAALPPRQMVR